MKLFWGHIYGLAKGESEVAKHQTGDDFVGLRAGREKTCEGYEGEEDPDGLGLCGQDEEKGSKARVVGLVQFHHLPSLLNNIRRGRCPCGHLCQVCDTTVGQELHHGHKEEHEGDEQQQGGEAQHQGR